MKRYNIPESGTSDWHIPLNENFENLERDVEIRDTESNLDEYEPKDGAKYLAVDTGKVYLGNGENWNTLGTIDEVSGSVDSSSISGITSARTNVGAMVGGTYHDNTYTQGGYGVVFEAQDLHIGSVVVDSDLSNVSNDEIEVQLREWRDGSTDAPVVDSKIIRLSGGTERVELSFKVPASGNGDPNDEYILQRGPYTDAEETDIPLRRRLANEDDWSEEDYEQHDYPDIGINFLRGGFTAHSDDRGHDHWYYFFDWLIGPEEDRVETPWSTDIDELYVRPIDPTEEFDDVSPRSLWIDTS
ncbi:hypothetical protein [Natronocalculus amylovorans]|uniref:Uncharacterized protein n=1 Tax=Natronocalculus amylovorans TaxID=2917812 RepID=A0AAE3G1U6_9EURY|nr:hypothetical protein [Natronocalculus amylovorans]MCL9818284.1 hypothetical protein [Natronocalculus amylovorans]